MYPIEKGLSSCDRQLRHESLARVADLSRSEFSRMVRQSFTDPHDWQTLRSVLAQHGTYAKRFFHRAIRERVARRFGEAQTDLHEVGRLLSLAWGYDVNIYGTSDAIYRIMDHIYEQSLVRAIREPEVNRDVGAWFERFSRPRTCVLCGRRFRVIDLPDWVYFGSNGFDACCFLCPIVESPRKDELRQLLPGFTQSCGFIPNADASPINYAFTSRLRSGSHAQVFGAYARMGGTEHVKKKFGSWFKALALTGVLPEGVVATARGVRCLAQDGHECGSLDEQRIDNWLFSQRVPHEREPPYPPHPTLNVTGRKRADWKVGDTYIEYFGLAGDPDYDRKIDEKLVLAEHLGVEMTAIYPPDVERLDERLCPFTAKDATL